MRATSRLVVLLLGIAVVGSVAYIALGFIGPLALGVFIYYSTIPIYRFLRNRGLGPVTSSLVSLCAFLLPAVVLVGYTLQILVFELNTFLSNISFNPTDDNPVGNITDTEGINYNETDSIQDLISEINFDTFSAILDEFSGVTFELISSASTLFFTLFIAFSLAFYLQVKGGDMKRIALDSFDYNRSIEKYLDVLSNDLRIVFLGNIALAILTAVIASTLYYLLVVTFPNGDIIRYPILLGLLCGISSLIPVVGMKIVYIPITVVLFGFSLSQDLSLGSIALPVTFLFVSAIIVDTIPDLVVRPYLGSKSGVPSGILLFSYILGPLTFGWYGLFLGPIIFVAFYEFVIILLPKIIREYKSVIEEISS